MKIAVYGTTIVVIHAIVNGLHGLAHMEIPVPLSLLQGLFVGIAIFPLPIIAAVLLWTPFDLIGSWLLLLAMASSLLFSIAYRMLGIVDGYISSIYCMRNPQKLERIRQELSITGSSIICFKIEPFVKLQTIYARQERSNQFSLRETPPTNIY